MPLLSNHPNRAECSPERIMSIIEAIMNRLNPDSQLRMSCITASWDKNSQLLTICNAGHTFPVLFSGESSSDWELAALSQNQQPPLGVHAEKRSSVQYQPPENATLLLYTDGLTEAVSPEGVQFSRIMYRKLKSLEPGGTPLLMLQTLVEIYRNHTGESVPSDDCCLLMVKMS